jgi:hypothetical protein
VLAICRAAWEKKAAGGGPGRAGAP